MRTRTSRSLGLWSGSLLLFLLACATPGAPPASEAPAARPAAPMPPGAEERPFEVVSPHGARPDPYYWLRDDDRDDPDVLAYLRAENAYTQAALAHVAQDRALLHAELVGRMAQDDATVPAFEDGYWYYARFVPGGDYPIHARRKGTLGAPEEVLLDGNALAEGRPFFDIGRWAVTEDGRRLAWTEDTVGRRQYTLRIRDLVTGETAAEVIGNVQPQVVWADDGRTVLTRRARRPCSASGCASTCWARIPRPTRWCTRRPIPASTWS